MNVLLIGLLAIGLSMDAFSLALIFGMQNIIRKKRILISTLVGIFHFFMPLVGLLIGGKILYFISLSMNILIFCILSCIGINMIKDSFKEEEKVKLTNILEILVFSFTVSLDSFSVGLGLKAIYSNPLICAFMFSFSSFIFTFIGLMLGNKIRYKIGKLSTIFGGILLIILAINYLL